VVLEKMPFAGGGAKFAADWRVFRSQWQKDRKLPDEMNRMLLKGMDATEWSLEPGLVYNALRNTGKFFDWFQTLVPDYEFVEGIYAMDRADPQAQRVPFVKPVNGRSPNGTFYVETLERECHKRNIPLLYRHRVVDVEITDGKVSAVIAQDPGGITKVNCKACVLASGSWIRNKEIMEKKFPEFWKLLKNMEPSQHASYAYTGDGIALAEKAGAYIDYNSFVLRCMGPLGQVPSMAASAISSSPKCVWVNTDGKRWMNEGNMARAGMSGSVSFAMGTQLSYQPGGLNYTIFDKGMAQAIKAEMDSGEAPASFFGPMQISDNYLEEMDQVASMPNGGIFVRGETLEELAQNAGIHADNLKSTVEHYNAMCAAGEDTEMFKPAAEMIPFTGGPYYAVQGHLNHDGAFGGVKINQDTRAYAKDGGLVENLFVPGDFASGRFTNFGGVKEQVINDLGWAISSGYTAGEEALKYLNTF
jgi:fumarate reductase flavoprotein subunit